MPLPYRTILRLPSDTNAVELAEQEVQTWLSSKLEQSQRGSLARGDYFTPGIHDVGEQQTLAVARADRPEDASRRLLLQFTETNNTGSWRVRIIAIDYPADSKHNDALVIEASRVDDPTAEGQVDPPRVVQQLLSRERIIDGGTHVTDEPHLIRAGDIDEVLAAITDTHRSVSVVVAASLGQEHDDGFRTRVKQLTTKTLGTTAVFFLTEEATAGLNERLPYSHRLEPGRVRTFLPKVELDDPLDGRRHRTLGPATFARAIHGSGVASYLKEAFAAETRRPLLDKPPASDIRRGMIAVDEALAQIERAARIEQRTHESLADTPSTPVSERGGVLPHLRRLISRWLRRDEPVTEEGVDALDRFIANQSATAEEFFTTASSLEARLLEEQESSTRIKSEREDLELDLADSQDEAATLRRHVEYLRSRLAEAGDHEAAYAEPHADESWTPPDSIVELATMLMPSSTPSHPAASLIEFTGDLAPVEELQKRDQVGRYANAFWEYVHVLYDFAERRRQGFKGNVHMYLTNDTELGAKCSPQRHAATESDSVINNPGWRAERELPVPETVHKSGRIFMGAHFKPTHRDTIAPRMHYYDDIDNTGKIYIGYIGRHLTNTQTKNS